ncbi:RNA-binding protein NOB1 [Leptopilina heterotoma]|uniref:RNA-binding protein NOB1 n=1 Tax=Leptopilina heterotoma TaxID=63436 RepID=UPI001CA8ABC7|nr:RNA-binding protein NOB1 [Leptopilina heterotoma]XP_043481810.1 RNA-binding protein NOB1 [Leptopilina heterotoma]
MFLSVLLYIQTRVEIYTIYTIKKFIMNSNKKVEYLITDTSAFIKNAALHEIGNNIITEPSVVNEITSKRQLRRLVALPYDLKVQEVFPEHIKFVTEFAKKTGDYPSLSATDIKVIALTYQLEKEKVGIQHLKTAPEIVRTLNDPEALQQIHPKCLAGFYLPENEEDEEEEERVDTKAEKVERLFQKLKETGKLEKEDIEDTNSKDVKNSSDKCTDSSSESNYDTATSDIEVPIDLVDKFGKLDCKETDLMVDNNYDLNDILRPVKNCNDGSLCSDSGNDAEEEDSDEDDDDDDDGWITPGNIGVIKKQMESDVIDEKPAVVACLTMDFAMQNVLMQIGLNIASLDGKVIKQMRTFILRCYACFRTTGIMTKVFCPHCGNKTLKKVSISIDENGKQHMHINFRRPLSSKGKKFSLPTPHGGKHANNPILCEDQPLPDQRPSRLARMKNDPLKDDYIAGYSPFVTRDVNSKSAMLGIRSGRGEFKHWMKRNPNECRRRRK